MKTAFGNDKKAAFMHFIQNGMAEGRQGSLNFNVHSYKNRYNDWYQCLEIILFCIISIILIMVIKREEKEFKEVFRKL